MHKTVRKVLRAVADYDPDYYDMYEDAQESFFAKLYVRRVVAQARSVGIHPPATLLEAGCQAGRLVVPLAQQGFRVTGIDTSGFALRRAREHAKAAGVDATFVQGDLVQVLRRHPGWRYDIIVCAEVLYLSPTYREMLGALAGALRPGGILYASHRPKFYYLVEAIRQYDMETARFVLDHSEGPFRDARYYNWHTLEELQALYQSLGLRWMGVWPIDRFAWLCGMSPSRLTEQQQHDLSTIETSDAAGDGLCGRYALVACQKPASPGDA